MPTKRPLEYWKQRNEQKTCKAPGCDKPRFRVGGYCQKHARAYRIYGHWNHQRLQRAYYMDELEECRSIIDKNLAADHPGILYAIRWLDLVLSGSVTIEGAHAYTDGHLSRLHEAGITGYDVLVECAAIVRLYDRGHPRRIHSHRHLMHMLGLRVSVLKAPRPYKRLSGGSNRALGTAINKKIGVLLRFISKAIDDREEVQQRELSVLYEPLAL